MKIEKINDNQIKCTLTKDDLAQRNLKISELAYGSEKTQNLFREMVRQADYEYGFETNNTPLVIEAVPTNKDSIVLIITKIDDPEELDTRFSRFSPYTRGADDDYEYDDDENPFEAFAKPSVPVTPSFADMLGEAMREEVPTHSFMFAFDSPASAMNFATQAASFGGDSCFCKQDNGSYLLIISIGQATKNEYKNVCMLASEYSSGRSISATACEYLKEHLDILIKENAIKKLSGK